MLCHLTVIVGLFYEMIAAPLVRVGWRPGMVFLAKINQFTGKLITLFLI